MMYICARRFRKALGGKWSISPQLGHLAGPAQDNIRKHLQCVLARMSAKCCAYRSRSSSKSEARPAESAVSIGEPCYVLPPDAMRPPCTATARSATAVMTNEARSKVISPIHQQNILHQHNASLASWLPFTSMGCSLYRGNVQWRYTIASALGRKCLSIGNRDTKVARWHIAGADRGVCQAM